MAVANLALNYVHTLVWPFVVVVLSVVFRRELRGLVERLASVDTAGTSLKFKEAVQETKDELVLARQEVETEAEPQLIIRRDPTIAAAARKVLDLYVVWPQAEYLESKHLGDAVGNATVELFTVVQQIYRAFQGYDFRLSRDVTFKFTYLRLLTGVTGVRGWRTAGQAIEQIDRTADQFLKTPGVASGGFGSRPLAVRRQSKRHGTEEFVGGFVDNVNSALLTLRALLEETERAHTGPAAPQAQQATESSTDPAEGQSSSRSSVSPE